MKFEVATPEELKHYKDRALMLKMLCLDEMNQSPTANTASFSKRQRVKLEVLIEQHWEDKDIVERFNDLCIQTIFEDGKMKFEEYDIPESRDECIPEV